MLKEFRAFILRGNVVDLAVGVVIGAAFGAVVTSLVKNILTPIVGVFGTPDFSDLKLTVGKATMNYGTFINDLIAFLAVAVAVFFFVVKPVSKLMARRKTEPETDSDVRDCPHCVSSIPKAASVCAFCSRDVPAIA